MTAGLPPAFAKIWLSHAITQTATKSTAIVLPLLAVVSFDATPGQVGLVNAAQAVPLFLFTLLSGAWLDTHARRPNLLVAHNARAAALLLAVPVLAFADGSGSGVWLLSAIAFTAGTLTALADVTYPVYVPTLVGPAHLVAANSRLEVVSSLTQVAAPGLGGLLIGTLGGTWSVALAGVLYLAGGAAVFLIRTPEGFIRPENTRGRLVRDTVAGARFLARTPMLRLLAAEAAWFNLFEQAVVTAYLVFAVRTLHLSLVELGASMGVGAAGAVLGSGLARRFGRALGMRRVLVAGMFAASAAPALIPAAAAVVRAPAAIAGLSFVLYGFGLAVFNVFSVSMRQLITPKDRLGRVTATFRFVAFGTIWVGALVGGGLGEWLGLEPTLWIAVAALVAGWAVFATRLRALLKAAPELREQTESLVGSGKRESSA
ncbi:MFS transporter [Amycolatopsis solani]|uniref:MFS transporter n=1 Tax=Amycolatopsis solani TaxID=3028615 RepID=UPI0025B1D231|nr:MFS transporter [Amycolatopsis sp. MEP2-6]